MLTILSALIGIFGSGLPSILSYFQSKTDNAQELAIMQIQLEMTKLQITQQLDAVQVTAESQENIALYQQAAQTSGIRFIDGLNACVRPIIALTLFFLYIGMNVYDIYISNTPMTFSDSDYSILIMILSFYFGSRHIYTLNGIK